MDSSTKQKQHIEQEADPTKMSRDQFDAQAEKYATSAVHKLGASLPVLLAMASPVKDDIVLDVATGTGNTALTLAPHIATVVGLDVSTKMLAQARSSAQRDGFANVSFIEGAAEHLPFEDASFTLVVSRHAPHHFRDMPQFLREVHRVLKPGGRFVLADQITPRPEMLEWVDFWQHTRDNSHFAQPTVQQWQLMAQEAGFSWTAEQIVPYRLEFAWWTQQAGCTPEAIEALRQHAHNASNEVRNALVLEFDENGKVQAHHEPILVARFDR